MSILIAEVLSEGMIFCADRNITTECTNGTTIQEKQQAKVLKWPTERHLFGFVGVAEIGGLPMHDWLTSAS